MIMSANTLFVKRFYDEVWNGFNLSVIDDLFATNYIVNGLPPWRKPGAQGLKEFITDNHRIFPDIHHEIEDMISGEDKVVVRFTASGTQEGDLQGPLGEIPATHKKVHWHGISIFRIESGKIAEVWGISNNLDLMKQLGAIR